MLRRKLLMCGMLVLGSTLTLSADDKKEKATIGPAVYELPGTWVKQRPVQAGNLGPIAQYGIPVEADDDASAKVQLKVYYFAGGGGGLQANVDRWVGMFADEGRTKKIENFEADGMKVTFVDITGIYKEKPFPMAEEFKLKKDYRMLAAVVETPAEGPYYFRAVGPSKTMAKNFDAFKNMLKSAKKAG